MSSDDLSPVDAADSDPLPGVPDVEDPQPSTPLTEDFVTGTANDPEVGSRTKGMAQITVDGRNISLPPGSTIKDALDAVETEGNVPALCAYDRDTEQGDNVGPRSECRTCVVETEEHGIVPSCSYPVEDGMTVRTDDEDAANMRDVNLDLTLSNHNLRCTTCGQNGRCELQDASIENGVHEPRYGVFEDRDEYVPLDDSSSVIQIDRNKCIFCNRCVEACNDVQVEGVLRMKGDTGQDLHIDFQNGADKFDDSTCVSCGHCATVCPTGSLVEKGLVDAATLPIPGFSQKNSIGKVIEHVPVETAETSDSPNRDIYGGGATAATGSAESDELSGVARYMAKAKRQARENGTRVGKTMMQRIEHVAEDVTSESIPAGWLFGIATTVADARLSRVNKAETTCNYCAVGCRFELYGKDGEILGVRPTESDDSAPANDFSTCVKGKFGYDFADSPDRLDTPLIKEDGEFREATWEEALDEIYENLTAVRDEYGTDSIAVTSSSKATNEENFLNQKFARQVLQTPHVDNCARLCHSSTVAGLQQTVGYGAMATRINEDVGETDCYLITGSNTTESHPVLATRIKQNARSGADLFVFDPRKVGLAEHATQYTRTRPGSDIAWINGMINHIISEDLHDEEFIENRTKHFEELKEKVEPFTPERVEELSSVPPEDLKEAAETIATADTCIFGWAMGMTQHAHGTRNVLAMTNLALVTGNMGKQGAGLSPFRGQNNVQGGGGDMGPAPHTLPGYQDLQDDEVLDKFEEAWGVRPPDRVGLRLPEQYEAMMDDELHGMYIMGENPALSEPNNTEAQEAVQKLDFLAVQDIFLTETAQYADVVLPAASAAEKSGTFTNTERRIQRVRPAIDPPGQAKSDFEILIDLAERFGYEWDYDDPSDVMEEISSLVPIYGGVDYDRLAAEDGSLQWPVWDTEHAGTPYLYEEEFNFEDGRARFVPADYAGPKEMPDEEYPLMLTTGRVLYHWHTGTMTRRVEALMHSVPESFVTIHPNMAETLGVSDGEYVRVSSRRGSIVVRADVEETSDEGVVFIPMHFARGAVNELTSHETDPTSHIPEYKVSSVKIEPLGADPDEEPFTVEMPGDATAGREEGRSPGAGESGADD
ncbi:formate dehydrogenase subunit alpha [Halopelagius longus]|uniref:Formate dehydrogenase major subunit n=1 Tax=Halopelagius longus TaxID=1236180 RepID=A0A1H1DI86_9EURY|nr:formate dehydrogenase subunit alpha [Halopelagius longus]RDI71345.1 formate dehydrogenase subunit alpha [Halopelagius longus]SDQ76214.1 formate dehydrogenase major subunit [Halopelagius longus]